VSLNKSLACVSAFGRSDYTPLRLADAVNENMVGALSKNGFDDIASSEASILGAAHQAVDRCLAGAMAAKTAVSALIFCSESFWDVETPFEQSPWLKLRDGVVEAAALDWGLSRAQVFGQWMSACSNFIAALRLAWSMVVAEPQSHVLIVLCDRVRPNAGRLMVNRSTVLGDMACAMLVSGAGALRFHKPVSYPLTEGLAAKRAGNLLLQSRALTASIETAVEHACEAADCTLADVAALICDNFRTDFFEASLGRRGLQLLKPLTPTRTRFGHAFSADIPLSLQDMVETSSLPAGKPILLLNIGPSSVGASVAQLDR